MFNVSILFQKLNDKMLKHLESKIDEDLQLTELKAKLQQLTNENEELKMSLKESQSNLSLAKCEISNLKALNDENTMEQFVVFLLSVCYSCISPKLDSF